jgi:hypothetical protein
MMKHQGAQDYVKVGFWKRQRLSGRSGEGRRNAGAGGLVLRSSDHFR